MGSPVVTLSYSNDQYRQRVLKFGEVLRECNACFWNAKGAYTPEFNRRFWLHYQSEHGELLVDDWGIPYKVIDVNADADADAGD